jgi:hypothetical protein
LAFGSFRLFILLPNPVQQQQRAYPGDRQIRIGQQPCGIGQAEHLGIVTDIAAGLKARRQNEMRLMAIQPRQIRNSGFVKPGRAVCRAGAVKASAMLTAGDVGSTDASTMNRFE